MLCFADYQTKPGIFFCIEVCLLVSAWLLNASWLKLQLSILLVLFVNEGIDAVHCILTYRAVAFNDLSSVTIHALITELSMLDSAYVLPYCCDARMYLKA